MREVNSAIEAMQQSLSIERSHGTINFICRIFLENLPILEENLFKRTKLSRSISDLLDSQQKIIAQRHALEELLQICNGLLPHLAPPGQLRLTPILSRIVTLLSRWNEEPKLLEEIVTSDENDPDSDETVRMTQTNRLVLDNKIQSITFKSLLEIANPYYQGALFLYCVSRLRGGVLIRINNAESSSCRQAFIPDHLFFYIASFIYNEQTLNDCGSINRTCLNICRLNLSAKKQGSALLEGHTTEKSLIEKRSI